MSNDCWQILAIEATSELQIIKKAYAKQLKHHKPDQDPEGFKRLRAAFETAKIIQSGTAAVNKTEPQWPSDSGFSNAAALIVEQPAPSPEKALIEQLEKLAADDDKRKILQSWRAILDVVDDFDIETKRQVSISCFEFMLVYAKRIEDNSSGKLRIPNILLEYLESLFHWSIDPTLADYFVQSQIEQLVPQRLLPQFSKFTTKFEFKPVDHSKRMMCALFDILICTIVGFIIVVFINLSIGHPVISGNESMMSAFFAFYLIYTTTCELGPWQRSYAKKLAGYLILNNKGEKPALIWILWRNALKIAYPGVIYLITSWYGAIYFALYPLSLVIVFHLVQLISPVKVYEKVTR